MHRDFIEQFVGENVPDHCSAESAVLELAALDRGLPVRRCGRELVFVELDDAIVPFVGMNGPDSSEAARMLCRDMLAQRHLLAVNGFPVPQSRLFAGDEMTHALAHAEDHGYMVNIGPARSSIDRGRMRPVSDEEGFVAAWNSVLEAYRRRGKRPTVLIEQRPRGSRLKVTIVDYEVVSVITQPLAAPEEALGGISRGGVVDLTDAAGTALKEFALGAASCIPGFAYGDVDLTGPDLDAMLACSDSRVELVEMINVVVSAAGHFPESGHPRDVAGSIIDHYSQSPQWKRARLVNHQPVGGGLGALWMQS